jgi:hypothetical protein
VVLESVREVNSAIYARLFEIKMVWLCPLSTKKAQEIRLTPKTQDPIN